MKTNDEIFELVISRRDEYKTEKRKRTNLLAPAATVGICVCIAAGVTVNRIRAEKPSSAPVTALSQTETATRNGLDYTLNENAAEHTASNGVEQKQAEQKNEKTTTKKESSAGATKLTEESTMRESAKPESVTEAIDSGYSSGGNGLCIPAVPAHAGAKPGVNITGEKITDSEAKAFFEENTWIASALASSGVPVDNIRFSEKGYCHVSYDGVEGKQLEVRQNFRDYPVYNGDKLIAIVTLTKENGSLSATPAFGGSHFDNFNAFLQQHKGEKLLFVYAGWMEMVITPGGKVVNPQGYDVSGYLEGVDQPYQYFYSEAATYTP